ncbi:MAG: alpha-hydroxy-acid oxidizing enzyme [Myxococcales bacterium]|nr:alpha-hydroxy-acid oxidizing enzyme [Myxococcales bacterium]
MSAALARCRNIEDLRHLASRRVPKPMFDYLDGAAEDEVTLRRNTSAFEDVALVPRYAVAVENPDLRTRVLGADLDWPVLLAPTGMSRLFHHHGEWAVAAAAQRSGTLYSLSTLSSVSIEGVAEVNGSAKMFQVYLLKDPGLNQDLMARAKAAGFDALCLTVDVPVQGNRERDLHSGMTLPPTFGPAQWFQFARCPAWVWNHLMSSKMTLANIEGQIDQGSQDVTSLAKFIHEQFDTRITWERVEHLAKSWDGPFAIKGLLAPDDARRAVDAGASAIIVSNHGGRQLDGAVAPFDVLESMVDAVGDRAEIILDGGVRRGSHVIKALAMGAKACMVGRPYLFGLGAGGEAGVDRALEILRPETQRALQLSGCRRPRDLDRSYLQRLG